jgi:hypothetical protein
MNLTQLERIKMELKQEIYGCLKVYGPIGKDQELPGVNCKIPRAYA